LGEGSVHLDDHPLDKAYSVDRPLDRQDQVMEGPPGA
jgi:hypothetical protein